MRAFTGCLCIIVAECVAGGVVIAPVTKPSTRPSTHPTTLQKTAPEPETTWQQRIREVLPEGWSLKPASNRPDSNWIGERDEPMHVIHSSPIAPATQDEEILQIGITVGPRLSADDYAHMVEFNEELHRKYYNGKEATLVLMAPWPWWEKRTPEAKYRPYLLPTHFDDLNSLRIHCAPNGPGRYDFKSKEDADEVARVLAAIASPFMPYSAAASRPATGATRK